MTDVARVGEEIIRRHSKSFSLASRLLPDDVQRHAVAVYAWCRRADDAIDLAEPEAQGAALATLEAELEDVYSGGKVSDPVLQIFQRSVEAREIPIEYARDLLAGMEMDVGGRRYETMDELLEYCYHVAGCVGLMMCHVMGLKDDDALSNAAHLGIAMQLTNICRDVAEDWERDRLYLPDDVLAEFGATGLADRLGREFPPDARSAAAKTIDRLLHVAEQYYMSGDRGLPALSWRCSVAIRTARVVYCSIGSRIRDQGCDPFAGRAFVSSGGKVLMVLGSVAASIVDLPRRLGGEGGTRTRAPRRLARFPGDILPIASPRATSGAGS